MPFGEQSDANCNKTNADFGLPPPQNARTELERERLRYDPIAERQRVTSAKARVNASGHSTWTPQMSTIYNQVCEHLANGTGDVMFVQGKAGVGKTTLNRVLLAECRARNMVGLVCAPTALAASLYENGMTCHEACIRHEVSLVDVMYLIIRVWRVTCFVASFYQHAEPA